MKFSFSDRCVFNLKAHIIFVVAYKRKAILRGILTRMGEIFEEVCGKHGAALRKFSGEPDHVHLLIEFSPSTRLSDLVRALKSVSSKKIREEFDSQIRKYLWGKRFWTRSYRVISVGDGATTEAIERYIKGQERPSS